MHIISARRDVLSSVMALVMAAAVAELGGVDVLDGSRMTGRPVIRPAEVFAAIATEADVHNSLEEAARAAAARLGATELAEL